MLLHRLQALIWLLSGVHFLGLNAYPTINIPFLLTSTGYGDGASRYKKSGLEIQTDADVAELEQLRENYGITSADDTIQPQPATNVEPADLAQELERQLEQMPAIGAKLDEIIVTTAAPAAVVTPDAPKLQPEEKGSGMHRPPTLPHDNGGKAPAVDNGGAASAQVAAEQNASPVLTGGSPPAPSVAKPFYGAARLAFGQNPEVLPTTTTTTSTATTITTSTATTSTTQAAIPTTLPALPSNVLSGDAIKTLSEGESQANTGADADADAEADTDADANMPDGKSGEEVAAVSHLGDPIKLATRRSVTLIPSKTVEHLLKRRNGQLSPFDMAQYVFWTGDEAGVARAVEELIDRRVLTRENALKFLREVRLGIEYLQQSYTNRIYPETEFKINMDKKTVDMPTVKNLKPAVATTENPNMPYLRLERPLQQDNENAAKALENLSVWHKLLALNNDNSRTQDLTDYDDTVDRAKVSQYLYTEYTLEDILYKLAKIMFAQSLAHGSDEAQHELQKLTDFLEREGNLGVIPIDLQKKVLHILFRALSDTLAERPELLPVASVNLARPYSRLPMRTLEP